MRLRRRLPLPRPRRLRGEDGLTTVEFAVIAPVILMIIMGVIEFSLIMFTLAVMESATSNTARLGKTGYVAEGSSREDQIVANIQNLTAGLLDPAKVVITSTVYASLDSVESPEPFMDLNGNGNHNDGEPYDDVNGNGEWDEDMGSAGLGNANDIVVYTATYPWPVMTPVLQPVLGAIFNLSTRMVVKNEPYDAD